LAEWAAIYDSTLNMDDPASSGFPSEQAEVEFKVQGERLGDLLRRELGDGYSVEVRIL